MSNRHRVTKFLDPKSGFWHLNYRLDGKRFRPSTKTANRKLAEILRQDAEKRLILGQLHLDPEIGVDESVTAFIRNGRENRKKKEKTLTNEKNQLDGFFRWAAVRAVNAVSTALLDRYIAHKSEKGDWPAPTSIKRFRETMHVFFEHCRKMGLSSNPVEGVTIPLLPEYDIRFLTLDEIDICLRALEGDLVRPIVATAIYAGLREEEICWLTRDDVDLDEKNPVIMIRPKEINGERWTPKTRKKRIVPISADLYPFLAAQKLKSAGSVWFFPSPSGSRWLSDSLWHRVSKLMKASNLSWGFRDFRHTFGSHLAKNGVSIFKIAKLMGNSPRVVERHYAHLLPEQMRVEVEFRSKPKSSPDKDIASEK